MNTYDGNTLNGTELFMAGDVINFTYSGVGKPISLMPGEYVFECWGAAGGSWTNGWMRGKGAYVAGELELKDLATFHVFVGQMPGQNVTAGGWNGGGNGDGSSGSGGASDIRLLSGAWNNANGLRSRIMVAGAGGGVSVYSSNNTDTSHGGELTGLENGYASSRAYGGTQTAGGAGALWTGYQNQRGANGAFGTGGHAAAGTNSQGSGGGGGWYGGGAGSWSKGGGGSSFISGHPGCNAVASQASGTHTGQPVHYSDIIFTNTKMIAGNKSMPDPFGENFVIGNLNHGYVRITVVFNPIIVSEIYFIKFDDKMLYFDEVTDDWEILDREMGQFTLQDIIDYGLGSDSPYLTAKHLHKLGKFGVSGRVEFIKGTHKIDHLKTLTFLSHDKLLTIGDRFRYNVNQ